MKQALTVKDLYVSYHGSEALHDINFSIDQGKMAGIIGPNGAGKSTLLKAILELIPKDKGEVRLLERPLKEIRRKIAYVPQRNDMDWTFPINVLDTVLLGTYPELGPIRRPKKSHKDWAHHCLEKVGMAAFSKRQIGELSGGQQQRVFLARALAQKAELFCLDEPFVGIDVTSEEMIVGILQELRDEGKTVLVVHHDLSKADSYFNELILLNKKLIQKGPVSEILEPDVMMKAYESQLSFLQTKRGAI
ncbi:metal ABC transporter ATP-binding protein [Bacillus sonorensis]|uniref:Manganese ABC transporter ATP-binding protein MntB n=2 Tax=Bacillus sonorensis TaxID=119858 RepID=M5PBP9_9BACI|nr:MULTISPECIES: metal ABC transporter ATP-binding protein [Bacillus]TWK79446.1 Fe(3+) dicitrate transport ATP-binding protein FecE [Bacillus paralicheniformis]EME73170.1 manganese ABC transporter ATP-binding protein MntB [Bacillus sonorensis L12]MBG9914169.1 manganese transporter [Bacillus sonorensis]MCF7616588.1 metal ABC transporter ATP-binding protein [Bacillus sonorensis]MCY7857487.1 metal ABC transporter ATP-binding protein [Bacillus sonorensis]